MDRYTLTADRIHNEGCREINGPAFVCGDQFGPKLLVVGGTIESALDEYDERFGERVDPEADAFILRDYPGETDHQRIDAAMNDGDIRINDGGTMVWVDPYEWYREYPNPRAAGRAFRCPI